MPEHATMTNLWQLVHPALGLYRYTGAASHSVLSSQPVLMLHGFLASHHSWSIMAEHLWLSGFSEVYALKMDRFLSGEYGEDNEDHLLHTVDFLLENSDLGAEQVILIGHGAGGILAYRYWRQYDEQARLSYLFMLAAPHENTVFPALHESYLRADIRKTTTIRSTRSLRLNFSRIIGIQEPSNTMLVNIFGNLPGQDFFDGVMRGLHLPEAVNLIYTSEDRDLHKTINKDEGLIEDYILAFLRGERYIVRLKLVGLTMQRDDGDGLSGPVAFEIDGHLIPPDTVFQAVTERLYLFEERVPPICTVAYPTARKLAKVTIHLRDLSNLQGRRRRMYTRLHLPLRDNNSSTHAMQDSEGSDFLWRVVCTRAPRVIGPTGP